MGLTGNENLDLILITVITIWSTLLKGIALWGAANLKQRNWFIVMLIVNTIGILELVYLFRFATKRLTVKEVKSWTSKLKKH
jgi:hypothetical protein